MNLEIHLLEDQPGDNNDRWIVTEKLGIDQEPTRVLLRSTDTGWKCVIDSNGAPVDEPVRTEP